MACRAELAAPVRLRPAGFGVTAFAGFAGRLWHRLAKPKLAKRAKAGWPGRTRTCNQTVMSGRISISFVDFAVFSFDFVRVRCALIRSFLVRNWCGRSGGPRSSVRRLPFPGCADSCRFVEVAWSMHLRSEDVISRNLLSI